MTLAFALHSFGLALSFAALLIAAGARSLLGHTDAELGPDQ